MASHSELNREVLLKLGVPAGTIETFGAANKNTRDEAVALRKWAEQNAASAFIIPTEIFPARRVRWIFQREFVGTAVKIEVPSFAGLCRAFRRNWVDHRGSADHRRLPKPQTKDAELFVLRAFLH
jgi:hypothetical protein